MKWSYVSSPSYHALSRGKSNALHSKNKPFRSGNVENEKFRGGFQFSLMFPWLCEAHKDGIANGKFIAFSEMRGNRFNFPQSQMYLWKFLIFSIFMKMLNSRKIATHSFSFHSDVWILSAIISIYNKNNKKNIIHMRLQPNVSFSEYLSENILTHFISFAS